MKIVEPVNKTHEVIIKLGGVTKVSRVLQIRPQAISLWIHKKRTPADRVPSLVRMARNAGFSIDPKDLRSDVDWDALIERG